MAAANDEQVVYWNEQAGPKWVELQERIDAQVEPLGMVAMERLAPAPGERILDVGCGCGTTSLALAGLVHPSGRVTGIDVSAPMLARARERARAAGVRTVAFIEADAAAHPFQPPPVDAA